MNDPQCTVCHTVMDPVAGLFQDFDDDGDYRPPEEGWHADMRPPGFGEEALPPNQTGHALAYLGERSAADPRFAIAAVHTVFQGMTGVDMIDPASVGDDPTLHDAYSAQQDFVFATATRFEESGLDLRVVVEDIVLSRYFRAVGDKGAKPGDLVQTGSARLLSPEALERKLIATTGQDWEDLTGDYLLLYGGIDSDAITRRLDDPNGVMTHIVDRLATDVACKVVSDEFARPPQDRLMLGAVERDWTPATDAGFEIPEAESAIRDALVVVHARLLGEVLATDAAEIDASYTLFYDVWWEGRQARLEGELDESLDYACQVSSLDGEDLPSEAVVDDDDPYVIRAWMAVFAYLLTDYRFLYE
jgi:hypothetical protein